MNGDYTISSLDGNTYLLPFNMSLHDCAQFLLGVNGVPLFGQQKYWIVAKMKYESSAFGMLKVTPPVFGLPLMSSDGESWSAFPGVNNTTPSVPYVVLTD